MILGGADAAQATRTRRWVLFTLVISILALVGGLILVLLLSQFYIVPHLQSDDFVQTQCYVRSIEILHIKKEGKVSKFDNPNCAGQEKDADGGKSSSSNADNYGDDFDFSLGQVSRSATGGATTSQSGLYNERPSGIFTRNNENRRNFPEGSTVRRGRARPTNIYRTNEWDPFASGYAAPLVGHHPSPPQAQVQHKTMSADEEARLKEAHPHLPEALVQHSTVLNPDHEEHQGQHRRKEREFVAQIQEKHPHLPKALAQHSLLAEPVMVKDTKEEDEEEQEKEEDMEEEDEDVEYIPGLPKALAQYAAAPVYTIRGTVKPKTIKTKKIRQEVHHHGSNHGGHHGNHGDKAKHHYNSHDRHPNDREKRDLHYRTGNSWHLGNGPHTSHRMSLAPEPGVHALVPAPANAPADPTPRHHTSSPRPQQSQRTSGKRDCSSGYVQAGTLCVHVSVLFRGLDGFVALGTLYADQKSLPRENRTDEVWPTKKCICEGCTITALSGNGSSVDEILVGKTRIKQGTRTRCYYPMGGGSHLLMFRGSNAVALHAILWPTLVFVSGFVGLFFSCLIMQKQRQQRRKQQTRPPMAYV